MEQIRSIRTFFLVLADIDPANISVRILSRFYIRINGKIETLCHCRQMVINKYIIT